MIDEITYRMVTSATTSSIVRVLVETKNIVPNRHPKVPKTARLKASFGLFCKIFRKPAKLEGI